MSGMRENEANSFTKHMYEYINSRNTEPKFMMSEDGNISNKQLIILSR